MRWTREVNADTDLSISSKTLERMTKSMNVKNVTCRYCDRYFTVDGNTARRQYCNDACQQAAYRVRRDLLKWLGID